MKLRKTLDIVCETTKYNSMVCETTKNELIAVEKNSERSALLPERHTDFFVCDILDAVPKGDMASMEHPIFSISTKPDRRVRRYESANGKSFVEITPSVKGLASVHDRDLLIFCISQCIAAKNKGQQVSKVLRFNAYDFLIATNRPTGGESYYRLRDTLERIVGTRISTNILTGDQEISRGFGLIESYEIVRETKEGRMQEVEVVLADWVFNAIHSNEVLTLHKNYFRLRKPLERRIYEIARKHCGRQSSWKISLEVLKNKCGSTSTLKEFRRLLGKIVSDDMRSSHMPDYRLTLDGDMLIFNSRKAIPEQKSEQSFADNIILSADAYQDAQQVAPGWDVYFLEQEWRNWMNAGSDTPPLKPDAAFVGFCKKYFERRGSP